MKKSIALLLALALCAVLLPVCAQDAPIVYVTIANGDLVLSQAKVAVEDVDNDGALTIADALYLAHENAFDGGAEAGFKAEIGQYGLMLTKLWGVENGVGYGYYVNNALAMGLADPVADGDYINAFVYTDLTAWSDTYSFFDQSACEPGEATLTLYTVGFDENYVPVHNALSGAELTINGEKTGVLTDENGRAVITVQEGDVVSAVCETGVLVPPCCVCRAAEEAEKAA